MDVKYLFSFVDFPCFNVLFTFHLPDRVQYWLSFGDLLLGNQFPILISVATIGFLGDVPYKFLLINRVYFLIEVHSNIIFLDKLSDRITHLFVPGIVLLHHGLIEVY